MRIMIVEDDADTAAFLEEALAKSGHQATTFGHGGLALGAVVRGNFELLICDLMLPNVSGIDTIKMVRSQFPYLPVIVVSAKDPEEWERKAIDAGASCFISKPVRLQRLIEEVTFVEKAQVDLIVGLLDPDHDHRKAIMRDLESMGCTTRAWDTIIDMLESDGTEDLSVLVVDAALGETRDALTWAAGREIAAVAFQSDDGEASANQDQLMRWGASFCLSKPVSAEALVTQARFFVGPEQ